MPAWIIFINSIYKFQKDSSLAWIIDRVVGPKPVYFDCMLVREFGVFGRAYGKNINRKIRVSIRNKK
jgi:hypothetical protein